MTAADVAARGRCLAAAVCGLAAAGLAFLVPVVGARAQPGYSQVTQYISELGASGSVHAALVGAGFALIGALVLVFLAFASAALPRSRRTSAGALCLGAVGAAYLAAAVFPCDPGCPESGSLSQSVHNFFGLLEYVGAVAGLLLLGAAFRRSEFWRRAAPACVVGALVVGLAFFAMLVPGLAARRGLSQRVADAAIFLCIGYVSLLLLRVRKSALPASRGARRPPPLAGIDA